MTFMRKCFSKVEYCVHRPLIIAALLCMTVMSSRLHASPPNILFVIADDWGLHAGAYGTPWVSTPNFDRIAKEGARCQNMFVTHALCSPSRATLMTGVYSHTHGVIDNAPSMKPVPLSIPFVSDHLRKAGYEVAFCGKSHNKGAFRDRERQPSPDKRQAGLWP